MRKIQLILSALIMFNVGCESVQEAAPELPDTMNYHEVSEELYQMFAGALGLGESLPLVTVVSRNQDHLTFRIEADKISEATRLHVFDFYGLQTASAYPISPINSGILAFNGNAGKVSAIIDTTSVLSQVQKAHVIPFISAIQTVENYADGYHLIATFRNQVIGSATLVESEKIFLLQMAAGSRALLQYLEKDGIQAISNNFFQKISDEIPAARALRCRVNWRDVWIGAVGTGLINASIGFYVGATAGTVTVPILGTATGAVGGAVFMGAIGFASGAIGGIATSLFTSCTRPGDSSLAYTFDSCDEAWDAYMQNRISQIPQECFLVSVSVKNL